MFNNIEDLMSWITYGHAGHVFDVKQKVSGNGEVYFECFNESDNHLVDVSLTEVLLYIANKPS